MTLLDSVKGEINTMVVDKISNFLSIARGNTSNAITAAIPLILGYITDKSQSEAGAEKILATVTDSELLHLFEDKTFQELYGRNRNALLNKGNALVTDVLGGKRDRFSEEIGKYANIPKQAADGMLTSIMPLILKVIGDNVIDKGADVTNLRAILNQEKDSFFSAIPAGLASAGNILGLSGMVVNTQAETTTVKTEVVKPINDNLTKTTSTFTTTPRTYSQSSEEKNNQGVKMLKWLLPLLGIIVLAIVLYFLMNDSKKEDLQKVNTEQVSHKVSQEYTLNKNNIVVDASGSPVLGINGEQISVDETHYRVNENNFVIDADGKKVLDNAGMEMRIVNKSIEEVVEMTGVYDAEKDRYIYNLGSTKEFTLPNGETLTAGEYSTEARLINFLSDDSKIISEDKAEGWMVLDRVYFETNTNNLDQSSIEQLNRIAQIMKAFPSAKLKLGGYTDNAGSQDINLPLSAARANIVMKSLVKSGIVANRLEAEGYGAQHFVCPANDTPECKAQNRRVDVKVTAK